MARVTNVDFLRAAYAEESGIVIVLLMSITHPSWDQVIRISTDPTKKVLETSADIFYGTNSRNHDFMFVPLMIALPNETEEGPLRMQITLDNVSRELISTIRALSSPPSVNVELVLSDAPDTVLANWPEFLLVNVQYDANSITGDLIIETLTHEPFPAGTFTPSEFPSLF